MYGFRPARNRQHPGDRPSKWAPLGRFGRVAILLTVVAGVVIALLIVGTRPADALDETLNAPPGASPEPPPWFGGRVEMPEHGFALTLPDDWVAFDTAGDPHEQARAVHQRYRAVPANDIAQLGFTVALTTADQGLRLLAMECSASGCGPSRASTCALYTASGVDGEVGEVGDALHQRMLDSPDVLDVEPAILVVLPAGPAVVLRATAENVYLEGVWGPTTSYVMLDDGEFRLMACGTRVHPDDDWLSIAETFEFLPAEE